MSKHFGWKFFLRPGKCQAFAGSDIGFQGFPCQPHIDILPALIFHRFPALLFFIPFQEGPGFIHSRYRISADSITHTEGAFIGKPVSLHSPAIQAACHNGKRTVSALTCFFTKTLRILQEFSERSPAHGFHNPLIISRPFLFVSVRAVLLQAVGQIPAGDNYGPSAQLLHCLLYQQPGPVMFGKGQAGKPHADKPVAVIILVHKIQRHHDAVIQLSVPFSQRSQRETFPVGKAAELPDKFRVILRLQLHLPRPELSEISRRPMSRGHMKIIRIHHRMRRQHHNRFRTEGCNFLRRPPVCLLRVCYRLFFTFSDCRNNQRRVR